MSSPVGSVRQRTVKTDKKRATTPGVEEQDLNGALDELKKEAKKTATREWDYKLAFSIITVLAFITRFWGISHPDQVVFDEVHFGKVNFRDVPLGHPHHC